MRKRRIATVSGAMSRLELAAQHALAEAQGDAVLALLRVLARSFELERELALARVAVSNGFSRGWHRERS